MTTHDPALDLAAPPINWARYAVALGRIGFAILLLAAWKLGADLAGPLYLADPIKVCQRIAADVASGALIRHTYVTLRLAAIGFAIGCAAGVALPFLLHRLPRLTAAIEPYIMASVGIPKYALVPLFILWFGIGEPSKFATIGFGVFFPTVIATYSAIDSVPLTASRLYFWMPVGLLASQRFDSLAKASRVIVPVVQVH